MENSVSRTLPREFSEYPRCGRYKRWGSGREERRLASDLWQINIALSARKSWSDVFSALRKNDFNREFYIQGAYQPILREDKDFQIYSDSQSLLKKMDSLMKKLKKNFFKKNANTARKKNVEHIFRKTKTMPETHGPSTKQTSRSILFERPTGYAWPTEREAWSVVPALALNGT